ncbi:MAG TPA: zinc-binding alcohol dehydrogenase family protein [Nitrospiraceae bacterium]|nr:zinc-binding alcohol dehydrogenase family protein [Nitrospiraceae bacterium]
MKAWGYFTAHQLNDFAIKEVEVPDPDPGDGDLLVRIQAISVNPVDYKIRRSRSSTTARPVILGWDAVGEVVKTGARVTGFHVGDQIYYAGDLMRDGTNAELHLVDHRLAARKPKRFSATEAAALPLTALTAWEALLDQQAGMVEEDAKVLIVGGAGGVGSIAIQLLKAKTNAKVIATASRPETKAWCETMGPDLVIDHSKNLREELKRHDIAEVDTVFGITQSQLYLGMLPDIIRPFGRFVLIDDPGVLDIAHFKRKSITVSWELMFTKSLFGYKPETQGKILAEVATLADGGRLKPTVREVLTGLSAETLRAAHTRLESAKTIGKIVIDCCQ